MPVATPACLRRNSPERCADMTKLDLNDDSFAVASPLCCVGTAVDSESLPSLVQQLRYVVGTCASGCQAQQCAVRACCGDSSCRLTVRCTCVSRERRISTPRLTGASPVARIHSRTKTALPIRRPAAIFGSTRRRRGASDGNWAGRARGENDLSNHPLARALDRHTTL